MTLSEYLGRVPQFDVDDDNIGTPESFALILASLAQPTWQTHEPTNHGIVPKDALAVIVETTVTTPSADDLHKRIWGF